MSEVAGRLAPQMGAWALEKAHGGRGILLGGVPGVPPAKVVVLGGGVVGLNAAIIALGMQADVWVLDKSVDRMRDLEIALDGRVTLAMSNRLQIEEVLPDADMVIGAVLVPGALAPKLVTREMLATDEAGRRARRRGDRPGRLLRDVTRDDARRPDLRGRRHRPLLRREHAGRRSDHVDEGPHERHAPVRRGDRRQGALARDRRGPGARAGASTRSAGSSPTTRSPTRTAWSTRRSTTSSALGLVRQQDSAGAESCGLIPACGGQIPEGARLRRRNRTPIGPDRVD